MSNPLGIPTSNPEVFLSPLRIPTDDITLSEARGNDPHPLRLNLPDIDQAEIRWGTVLSYNPAISVMGVWAEGELVGEAYTIPTRKNPGWVELGFQILRDHRRHGYATAAAGALASTALLAPGTETVWAKAASSNIASGKVLEAAGFNRLGTVEGQDAFIFRHPVAQGDGTTLLW